MGDRLTSPFGAVDDACHRTERVRPGRSHDRAPPAPEPGRVEVQPGVFQTRWCPAEEWEGL